VSTSGKGLVLWLCVWSTGACWSQASATDIAALAEGIAAYEAGQWQASADALARALGQQGADVLYRLDALAYMGRVQVRLGNPDRARDYFRQLLGLQPDYRLNRSDPAGLDLFEEVLRPPAPPLQPQAGRSRLTKLLIAAAVLGGGAAFLLLSGGGGGGTGVGSIGGEIALP